MPVQSLFIIIMQCIFVGSKTFVLLFVTETLQLESVGIQIINKLLLGAFICRENMKKSSCSYSLQRVDQILKFNQITSTFVNKKKLVQLTSPLQLKQLDHTLHYHFFPTIHVISPLNLNQFLLLNFFPHILRSLALFALFMGSKGSRGSFYHYSRFPLILHIFPQRFLVILGNRVFFTYSQLSNG